jgi:hypothetical protein
LGRARAAATVAVAIEPGYQSALAGIAAEREHRESDQRRGEVREGWQQLSHRVRHDIAARSPVV